MRANRNFPQVEKFLLKENIDNGHENLNTICGSCFQQGIGKTTMDHESNNV
jgi:hypothetical protein